MKSCDTVKVQQDVSSRHQWSIQANSLASIVNQLNLLILIMHHRFEDSLTIFRSLYDKVSHVFDVGVQGVTRPLLTVYPDKIHILYEPVSEYKNKILHNYRDVSFELVSAAVGFKAGSSVISKFSADNSGNITHASLSDRPHAHSASSAVCPTVTLSNEFKRLNISDLSAIVKIDIDGKECDVLSGMMGSSDKVALIVMEVTVGDFYRRIKHCESLGFSIFDITSPGYYFDVLCQVDMFFINNKLRESIKGFKPFQLTKGLEWNNWKHLP